MPGESFDVFTIDDKGEGKPLPLALEGLPAKDGEGNPIHYRKMLVAPCGDWTHRGTGEPLPIDEARAKRWVNNTTALIAAGAKPWITPKHLFDDQGNFITPDARDTLGYVERMSLEDGNTYAIVGLYGDESLKIAAKNSRSIGVSARDIRDDRGGTVKGEALHHLALVPNSALLNLGNPTKIAASADSPAVNFYTLASASHAAPSRRSYKMKPELAKQVREKLGFGADVLDDQLVDKTAEKALALSGDVATLNTTIAAEKKRADDAESGRKAEADKVLALSANAPKKLDDITRAMYVENVSAKRETAIRSGALSEAEAKSFDELLSDAQGPTSLALSACGPTRKPFAFELWDRISKLGENGVRVGNATNRDPNNPARNLALSGGGDSAEAAAMLTKEKEAAEAWRKNELTKRGVAV